MILFKFVVLILVVFSERDFFFYAFCIDSEEEVIGV